MIVWVIPDDNPTKKPGCAAGLFCGWALKPSYRYKASLGLAHSARVGSNLQRTRRCSLEADKSNYEKLMDDVRIEAVKADYWDGR